MRLPLNFYLLLLEHFFLLPFFLSFNMKNAVSHYIFHNLLRCKQFVSFVFRYSTSPLRHLLGILFVNPI